MRVRMWKSKIKTGAHSEEHDLHPGYNEFYLPSVNQDEELWVRVSEDDGTETVLHLKR